MGLLQLLRKLKRSDSEARILVLGLDNAGKTTILKKMGDEKADNVMPTQGFNIKTLVKEGFKLNMWDIGGTCLTLAAALALGAACGGGTDGDTPFISSPWIARDCTSFSCACSRTPASEREKRQRMAGEFGSREARYQHVARPILPCPTNVFDLPSFLHPNFIKHTGQQSIRPYWKNYYKNTDALVFVVDSSDEARMDEAVSVLDDLLHKEDDLAGKPVLLLGNKQDLLNAMDMEQLIGIFSDTIGSATFAAHGVSAVSGEGLQAAFEELVRMLNNDTSGGAAASTDTAAAAGAAGGTGGDK